MNDDENKVLDELCHLTSGFGTRIAYLVTQLDRFRRDGGRDGKGRNGDGTWPASDGRGCPLCGAVRNGGHGGGCPNTERYDEQGNVIR